MKVETHLHQYHNTSKCSKYSKYNQIQIQKRSAKVHNTTNKYSQASTLKFTLTTPM